MMKEIKVETGKTGGNYNRPFLKELLEPEIYVRTFNVPDYDLTVPKELVNEIKIEKPDCKLMYMDYEKR